MKKNLDYLEDLEKIKSKREYHIKYNYMKKKEIEKIIEDLEKEKEKYIIKSRYNDIEEIKEYSIYNIEDLEILEYKEKYIIIRKDEKSFFYNKFIQEEYRNYRRNNEKDNINNDLLKYIKNISNFLYFEKLKFIILDIEDDYIIKNK